jgi:transposase-like protein
VTKAIIDTQVRQVVALRYRCLGCARTFRDYPEGVCAYRQSQRLMGLAALLWALGLSMSATSHVLHALEAGIHKSSVLRDVHRAGLRLQDRKVAGRVRVLGADETVMRIRGCATLLGFVTDAQTGKTVGVDLLLAADSRAFLRWLQPYVERLGVEVLVSDDLNTYKPAVEALGLEHQVCLAHVRKWVTLRLQKIAGWEEEKALIRQLVRELPSQGGWVLLSLERRVRRSPPLRRLVVDLLQRWPALLCHRRRQGVPSTNNRTEQAIAKSKMRYKTVRGYKSVGGALAGVALTQWLYSGAPEHHLVELVA